MYDKVDCFHIRLPINFHIFFYYYFNTFVNALALLFVIKVYIQLDLWQHYLSPIDIIVC